MTSITLKYEWKYTAYGTRWKRYYEHPTIIRGVQQALFTLVDGVPQSEQLALIRQTMITNVKEYCRPIIRNEWEEDEEEIDTEREVVKIFNVREYNIWMGLEDM